MSEKEDYDQTDWLLVLKMIGALAAWLFVFIGLYGEGIESLKMLIFGVFLMFVSTPLEGK